MSKERPILMNSAMVRATLGGTKSQTRRVVKQLDPREGAVTKDSSGQSMAACWAYGGPVIDCPYGVPGQGLWVRETFFAYGRWETRYSEKKARDEWHFIDMTIECDRAYQYDADSPDLPLARGRGGALPGWYRRPAIFMPRAASRIQLTIISVRVERLNDCSEADAKAEGVLQLDADVNPRPETRTKNGWQICPTCGGTGLRSTLGASGGVNFDVDCTDCDTHLKLYRHLWEAINGKGSWDANPWVWVVEFKRVTP